jgi:hypothetical protein
LAGYPDARDIDISGAGLEQAFLQLTSAQDGAPADDSTTEMISATEGTR